MRIGLVDVDGHAKKKKWGATVYPNLALCKIAGYHKTKYKKASHNDAIFRLAKKSVKNNNKNLSDSEVERLARLVVKNWTKGRPKK